MFILRFFLSWQQSRYSDFSLSKIISSGFRTCCLLKGHHLPAHFVWREIWFAVSSEYPGNLSGELHTFPSRWNLVRMPQTTFWLVCRKDPFTEHVLFTEKLWEKKLPVGISLKHISPLSICVLFRRFYGAIKHLWLKPPLLWWCLCYYY